MKISTATLGMDATLTHKDVQLETGRLSLSQDQDGDEMFTLPIQGVGRSVTQQRIVRESQKIEAASAVDSAGEIIWHRSGQERVVGQVVSEILNQGVAVRSFSPVLRENSGATMQVGNPAGTIQAQPAMTRVTVGLTSVSCREENVDISTKGKVETEDGRVIDLSLDLKLSRTEYVRQTVDAGIVSARFIDPLVLSFTDGIRVLESGRFMFDLNGDGGSEEISCLGSGSGYLVLDRNGDGRVNDGLELFGPATGFGYGELAGYDSDGNLWIDDNDPVFARLQLWMGAGSKDARLVSLKEAGVGALSLSHTGVGFDLKGADGRVLGRVQRSGIFLSEAGEVRPMAEIDLATDETSPGWPGLSGESRAALKVLREMLEERSRRVSELALHWQKQRSERHREQLLERLFAFREGSLQMRKNTTRP